MEPGKVQLKRISVCKSQVCVLLVILAILGAFFYRRQRRIASQLHGDGVELRGAAA